MKYRISLQRVKMTEFRGHKIPFTIQVWLHYPGGSRRWFNLWGPASVEWIKQNCMIPK